jgi:hypothetical protein
MIVSTLLSQANGSLRPMSACLMHHLHAEPKKIATTGSYDEGLRCYEHRWSFSRHLSSVNIRWQGGVVQSLICPNGEYPMS